MTCHPPLTKSPLKSLHRKAPPQTMKTRTYDRRFKMASYFYNHNTNNDIYATTTPTVRTNAFSQSSFSTNTRTHDISSAETKKQK